MDFSWLWMDLEEYDRLMTTYGLRSLSDSRVLEIGYGARPYRLIALLSLGIDASGVDAEVPILDGTVREFRAVYERNGFQRLAKSIARRLLFDRRERSAFERELRNRGYSPKIIKDRFLVSDAAKLELPAATFDLIFSEDVFEHISPLSLKELVPKMATWLKPTGLALIRPNVFTGITGGHFIEWYQDSFRHPLRRRESEPWEHLRKQRFCPDTYLNRYTRADYRELFLKEFAIVDEVVKIPDLGRSFFTAEVAADLVQYKEDELFSNQVLFVLRPDSRAID